jgi:lantibiotic transport system permease protein
MNLTLSLRSEILKTKRTASFYFTLIGAAAVPIIFLLNALGEGLDSTKKDPLNLIFKLLADMNGLAFFPWFIILICTLLPQIEYRNNTWKQVFSSPQPKVNILAAKFLTIHLLMLLFLVSTHVFMFLAIAIANFIDPGLQLFSHPLNGGTVLLNAANAYLTMLALCAIHFWLGIRFKNFIVSIALGLALWLGGTLLALQFNSITSIYFPYSFQAISLSVKLKPYFNQVAWTSVVYALLFLILGFLDLRRRRMNN